MDWRDESGLVVGLRSRLNADIAQILEREFRGFQPVWGGHRVPNGGEHIWQSIREESYDPPAFRSSFQEAFVTVLTAAKSGTPLHLACGCVFHRGKLTALQTAFANRYSGWLQDFLDILAAHAAHLRARWASPIPVPPTRNSQRRLSRFLQLDKFVNHHLPQAPSDAAHDLRERLHPSLPANDRMSTFRTEEFGDLAGRLGSYPHLWGIPNEVQNQRWCENIYPFATITLDVTQRFNRLSSPDRILQSMGLPFEANQWWIELQYTIPVAAIVRSDPKTSCIGSA